ncbi:hypothetical protein DES44_3354 [Roseateles depolymerans]|uniref:Uncharacterized protein n=1 Tax=Roseateles depolymerans TaxID=76731 RepID=A0A0U3C8N9_9BURK|nr:hypothetical protein RD2015_631 [Roseateles depolymerans]REG14857.1 hypothetical protein DES44_3354 [Roseateles depolymerans]
MFPALVGLHRVRDGIDIPVAGVLQAAAHPPSTLPDTGMPVPVAGLTQNGPKPDRGLPGPPVAPPESGRYAAKLNPP